MSGKVKDPLTSDFSIYPANQSYPQVVFAQVFADLNRLDKLPGTERTLFNPLDDTLPDKANKDFHRLWITLWKHLFSILPPVETVDNFGTYPQIIHSPARVIPTFTRNLFAPCLLQLKHLV